MSFESFLDHTCDIYHLILSPASPGYGLRDSPKPSYPEEPDVAGQVCHFAQSASGGTVNTIVQDDPQRSYDDRIKVNFPLEADVRLNDKIVDNRTDPPQVFYAEVPRTIRNHHKYVYVKRSDLEAAL